jgi:5'-3' exonuclease
VECILNSFNYHKEKIESANNFIVEVIFILYQEKIMGIQGLFALLKDECPEVIHHLEIKSLSGISVAIDISIFFNFFVKSKSDWLVLFINFLLELKKNQIYAIFIFDGPEVPPEKNPEQQKRRDQTNKSIHKLERGKELLPYIKGCIERKEFPLSEVIDELKAIIGPIRAKNLQTEFEDIYSIHSSLITTIEKIQQQTKQILPEYTPIARDFIESLGFDHYLAKGEAEALCASMAIEGSVDAVITEDSDVLVYGCPYLICKWRDGECDLISLQEVLDGLGLKFQKFRDLCILMKCDYNKGNKIVGFPPDGRSRKTATAIGAKGAMSIMRECENLEEAEKYIENPEDLIYQRCREIFIPPSTSFLAPPSSRGIDEERLEKLWKKHRVPLSLEKILKAWRSPEILFNVQELVED